MTRLLPVTMIRLIIGIDGAGPKDTYRFPTNEGTDHPW